MGSYPNDRVDATPNPRFGGTSSSSSGKSGPPSANSGTPANPNEVGIAPGARPWRAHRRPSTPHARWSPSPEELQADRRRIYNALVLTIGCLVLVWGVFLIDLQFDLGLNRYGNRPLKIRGLIGIFSMAFLHGGWSHIWGNTVSFFTLSVMLLYFYRGIGPKVLFWSWAGSGLLLWTSGAAGNHIGLSGVVYALAAFLFLSGVIRKHTVLMRVALVVVFLYGSIVWGVFPIEVGVSWEGHLTGACVGGLLALVLKREGPQPPPLPTGQEGEEPGLPVPDTALSDEGLGILGTGLVEDTWLTAAPGSTMESPMDRRQSLLWKGPRPVGRQKGNPNQRGIRKERKGAHLKARSRRSD